MNSNAVSKSTHTDIVSQTIVIRKYCTFTVHDIINQLMSTYYEQVNSELYPLPSDCKEEQPPDYKYNNGTTYYTSHYKYHTFNVCVKRNTDRDLQVSASIIPKQNEEATEEMRFREQTVIQKIALKDIIKNIKYYGETMRAFEECIEAESQKSRARLNEAQDECLRSNDFQEELERERQEESDSMYAAYLDDLSCGFI